MFDRDLRLASPGGGGTDRRSPPLSPEVFSLCVETLLACKSTPGVPPPLTIAGEDADKIVAYRIGDCLWQLICRLTDLPTEATRPGLCQLAPLADSGQPYLKARAVVVASLAQNPDLIQRMVNEILADTRAELLRLEWEYLLTLDPFTLRDWVVQECYPYLEMDTDDRHTLRMRFLDSLPGYPTVAETVLVRTEDRLRAIAERRVPYVSDGAFLLSDCAVIERAVVFGLMRGDAWCVNWLGDIWQMASVAPDPKAKTMPSQSLTIRFANASIAEPRPEALQALEAVAKNCRHAGVAKKLDRARKSARTALAAQTDRLLALDPGEPIPKDLLKPFAAAIEGLLAVTDPMSAELWAARLGPSRKEGWALAKALIWEVTPAGGQAFTALPATQPGWVDLAGTLHAFEATDLVRLWHPADTSSDLARAWRSKLQSDGVKQPFLQAGREVYRPDTAEFAGREVKQFAGHYVSARQLVGLARTAGWRAASYSGLHLRLGGTRFRFDPGVRAYHGSEDTGETGSLWLEGPEACLMDVPARVLSEALRKVDLLVAVGERGAR
ncbi:MAG: DUF4132 domain-containing protein [Tabrizicola sp.]|nr:DUF4132 domain-containing protein [Tabrizicola sp.]